MARRATGLSDRRVGLIEKALDNVFMTASACVGVLGGLDDGFRGRKKSGHAQGQSQESCQPEGKHDRLSLFFRWQLKPPSIRV
jgi:hypothetical protein